MSEENQIMFNFKNLPPLNRNNIALCRAITRYVDQRLKEVAK